LSRSDAAHEACKEQVAEVQRPLLTCWPVLTEAAWLLRRDPGAITQLLKAIEAGLLEPLELGREAAPWLAQFLDKYRDLGAQLADAAIMYLADREGINSIFTLDRRDFSVYRLRNGQSVRILPAV
jgi:predicted nucleic acid-binding protein